MGIAAFFGIGAYTAAIITTHGGNFFLALAAGMVVSGAFGAILGVISLRLQADFLAITTIGINFVMEAVFNRMKITGGTLGLTIAKPVIFGVKMGNKQFFFLAVIFIVILKERTIIDCWLSLFRFLRRFLFRGFILFFHLLPAPLPSVTPDCSGGSPLPSRHLVHDHSDVFGLDKGRFMRSVWVG
jgi:hypothetical protein